MPSHTLLRLTGTAAIVVAAVAACASPGALAPGDGNGPDDPEGVLAARQAAVATFVDPEAPKQERLNAAQRMGYPSRETAAALLAVGADRTEDDDIRWEALRHHPFRVEYVEAVLAILADPADGGPELRARLIEDIGRRTTFELPSELEQRMVEVLRLLLDSPHERVRIAAYRVLVGVHDTVAVSRLSDSMRAGEAAVPIPLVEAIRLLNLDGSVFHLEVLRPFLEHEDAAVRAEAARGLAADPDSLRRIVEMTVDPESERQVRLRALRALAREDERFGEYAIPLVANRQEDPTVRYAAMKAFVGRMNYFEVDPETQIRFAEVVARIAAEQGPRSSDEARLHRDARALLDYLKKGFPAIAQHYARR